MKSLHVTDELFHYLRQLVDCDEGENVPNAEVDAEAREVFFGHGPFPR